MAALDSPFGARRLEVVAILVVGRLHRLVVGRRAIQLVVGVLQLVLQLVDLLLVRRDVLLAPPSRCASSCCSFVLSTARAACCSCACVTWYCELREAPLRVLPFAVVVVPDHPDDRQEQEQAGRREDDVQEVDVVSVPDALLFSHDLSQMLKKNSGIATMYFRLNSHRASILIGSDIIIRNRNDADVVARRAQLLVVAP